jgi:tetratricopeptide (TPR) repeat protein
MVELRTNRVAQTEQRDIGESDDAATRDRRAAEWAEISRNAQAKPPFRPTCNAYSFGSSLAKSKEADAAFNSGRYVEADKLYRESAYRAGCQFAKSGIDSRTPEAERAQGTLLGGAYAKRGEIAAKYFQFDTAIDLYKKALDALGPDGDEVLRWFYSNRIEVFRTADKLRNELERLRKQQEEAKKGLPI